MYHFLFHQTMATPLSTLLVTTSCLCWSCERAHCSPGVRLECHTQGRQSLLILWRAWSVWRSRGQDAPTYGVDLDGCCEKQKKGSSLEVDWNDEDLTMSWKWNFKGRLQLNWSSSWRSENWSTDEWRGANYKPLPKTVNSSANTGRSGGIQTILVGAEMIMNQGEAEVRWE